ncbi:MAG: SEC-C metal-binding domain-containing protein [Deltaproteobacteria bacterium]|jgi:hypothetical protein|nr:SEC-C metal-binding domain-containing protein [Deltaproteobacteria bacterium]MCW8892155.1 SEC-C metal-binding domain-containing protein [Deltaproteobacteria bacterium]MCW9050046.1 SEC-C metal-binding domain-containing protein [Deltaproteobacteria bacterium]
MGLFARLFGKENITEDGPVPPEILPQRNDLCWCGSDLKYKKCHLESDQAYLLKQREQAAKKACGPVFG